MSEKTVEHERKGAQLSRIARNLTHSDRAARNNDRWGEHVQLRGNELWRGWWRYWNGDITGAECDVVKDIEQAFYDGVDTQLWTLSQLLSPHWRGYTFPAKDFDSE